MELYLAFYLRHSRCLIKDNNIIINTIIHLKKAFIFKTHLFCEHFSYSSSTQNCVLLIFPITSCYSFIIRLIIALYSSFFFFFFWSLFLTKTHVLRSVIFLYFIYISSIQHSDWNMVDAQCTFIKRKCNNCSQ